MSEPLRLDFGCGPNPKSGFIGVDRFDFPGVGAVADLARGPWVFDRNPFGDAADTRQDDVADNYEWGGFVLATSSVDEAHASHFLEHLTNLGGLWERVRFFNELHRVLKPGAGCLLIFPHWASTRYYGDPTHKEPFSEMGFYYLSREWRLAQAPHTDVSVNPDGYSCDFEASWGYSILPATQVRSAEFQNFALTHYLESRQDIIATLKARK